MKKGWLLKLTTNPIVSGVLKTLPFGVGSLAQNILSEHKGAGNVDKKELPAQLIKIGIYVVLLYLIFNNKLSFEDAENYKEFIND